MDFMLRDVAIADIDRCIGLLPSPLFCDAAQYGELRAMWTEIVSTKCGIAAIVVDPARDAIIHFGFNVFVSDETTASYHRCEAPLIARRILGEWARGGKPFFDAKQIARANAGDGLNIVVTHYGGVRSGSEPDERMVAANYESSRRVFSGWNLRSYTSEIFDDRRPAAGRDWGRQLGFRIGEYSAEQLQEAGISLDSAPCVWWARREDAGTNPGYALTQLFTSYARPRFGLSGREQELLKLALDGHTDASLAHSTQLSVSMVKKRFRAVYEKVDVASPSPALAQALANGRRGAETRRHLLNYLREHPEELRPYDRAGSPMA